MISLCTIQDIIIDPNLFFFLEGRPIPLENSKNCFFLYDVIKEFIWGADTIIQNDDASFFFFYFGDHVHLQIDICSQSWGHVKSTYFYLLRNIISRYSILSKRYL
jgi:hypothetical protein